MPGTGNIRLIVLAAIGLIAACDQRQAEMSSAAAADHCVDIPEGYYLFADGKFSPTSSELVFEPEPVVTQRRVAWSNQIAAELEESGYDWLELRVTGPVALLSGTAPTPGMKTEALQAAQSALAADAHARDEIRVVVDALMVDGGPPAPGQALTELGRRPTRGDCQSALISIMDGRDIDFNSETSGITADSSRLLDAVAGVALICSDYELEIGSHTDARGAQSYNQELSQKRAEAVKAYLVDSGVEASRLRAVGYGETRPIDPAQTSEAYARNRRTEFTLLD